MTSVAAGENSAGADIGAGTRVSSEQTDEKDWQAGVWCDFKTDHLGAGTALMTQLNKSHRNIERKSLVNTCTVNYLIADTIGTAS